MSIVEHVVSGPVPFVDLPIDPVAKIVAIAGRGVQVDSVCDLLVRLSSDGTTFDAGVDAYAGTTGTSASSIPLVEGVERQGAAASTPAMLDLDLDLGSATMRAAVSSRVGAYQASGGLARRDRWAYRKSNGRIAALRILPSAGNIVAGTFFVAWA